MHRIAKTGYAASLLVAATIALPSIGFAQNTDEHRYDLNPVTKAGTSVWFVETTRINQQLQMAGRPTLVRMQVARTFGITIKQVGKSGSRIVEVHVARVAGWMHVGGTTESAFDSNFKITSGHGALVDRMMSTVGRRFIARIDKHGKLAGSIAGVAYEMRDRAAANGLRDKELAALAETAFGRTPKEPTAIGGTWKSVHPGIDSMLTTRNTTMKLVKATEETFVTEMAGTVEKGVIPKESQKDQKDQKDNSPEAQMREQLTQAEMNKGQITGTQSLSRKDGLLLTAKCESTFELDLRKTGRQQQIQVEISTTLARTKKPDRIPNRRPPRSASEAEVAKAGSDIKMISGAVRMFYVRNSALPASLDVLAKNGQAGPRILASLPKDPWGNAYKMVLGETARDFEVKSAGADGKHGTDDDLPAK